MEMIILYTTIFFTLSTTINYSTDQAYSTMYMMVLILKIISQILDKTSNHFISKKKFSGLKISFYDIFRATS